MQAIYGEQHLSGTDTVAYLGDAERRWEVKELFDEGTVRMFL
jgi:hypothetical protein